MYAILGIWFEIQAKLCNENVRVFTLATAVMAQIHFKWGNHSKQNRGQNSLLCWRTHRAEQGTSENTAGICWVFWQVQGKMLNKYGIRVGQSVVNFNKCSLVAGLNCWFFMPELQLCSACGLFAVQCKTVRVWPFGLCPVTLPVETVSSVCYNWDPLEMQKIPFVYRCCVFSWNWHQVFTLQVPWLQLLGTESAEGKCFPGERVTLLGAPPDPWFCHVEALRSKMNDNQVKCKDLFFTCKWHCSQGAKTFLKFMLGTAWWKCRYVFITGGTTNDYFSIFWGSISALETSKGEQL